MLLKERKVSFKRRKWSKLCPGSANTLLGYPQHKIGMFQHKSGKLQLDYLTCHETVWAMWCYEQTFNSSGLACFQSSLLRQSYHFHKTFGCFLECGVLLELFLTAETLQLASHSLQRVTVAIRRAGKDPFFSMCWCPEEQGSLQIHAVALSGQ